MERFACDKRKMMMRKIKLKIAQQIKWHDMVHKRG